MFRPPPSRSNRTTASRVIRTDLFNKIAQRRPPLTHRLMVLSVTRQCWATSPTRNKSLSGRLIQFRTHLFSHCGGDPSQPFDIFILRTSEDIAQDSADRVSWKGCTRHLLDWIRLNLSSVRCHIPTTTHRRRIRGWRGLH